MPSFFVSRHRRRTPPPPPPKNVQLPRPGPNLTAAYSNCSAQQFTNVPDLGRKPRARCWWAGDANLSHTKKKHKTQRSRARSRSIVPQAPRYFRGSVHLKPFSTSQHTAMALRRLASTAACQWARVQAAPTAELGFSFSRAFATGERVQTCASCSARCARRVEIAWPLRLRSSLLLIPSNQHFSLSQ
jgi:hypothetical protein